MKDFFGGVILGIFLCWGLLIYFLYEALNTIWQYKWHILGGIGAVIIIVIICVVIFKYFKSSERLNDI